MVKILYNDDIKFVHSKGENYMSFYRHLNGPISVQIEMTNMCNCNCIYCYNYWRGNDFVPKFLSYDQIDQIVSQLVREKVFHVVITGGEPLLCFEKTCYIVSKLLNCGINVNLNTNAQLLTEVFCQELKKVGLKNMLVSLPSCDPDVHKIITNSNGFLKTVNGIDLAVKNGFSVSVNMVVNKKNVNHVFETAMFVANYGVKSFSATKATPPVGVDLNKFKEIDLSDDEFQKTFYSLIKIQEDLKMNINVLECYPLCSFPDDFRLSRLTSHQCLAGVTNCTIGTDGETRPCTHSHLTYGNVFSESLSIIWERMKDWRNGEMIPKKCKECNLLKSCSGGCRMESYARTGKINELDRWANPNNIVFKELLNSQKMVIVSAQSKLCINKNVKSRTDNDCSILSVSSPLIVSQDVEKFVMDYVENKSFTPEEIAKKYQLNLRQVLHVISKLVRKKIIIKI
ncbi:MAG: radical SAM protein [Candidatus Paceibacterota bacterium]|nr:radical SAM protein [Candidatus Paceibacterota bacterium]